MSGTTILVIDDDASIHRAVEQRLEGVVDQVLKADSPTKGLQIAIQDKPDVILLDLNMPQIDGFKVCRHLQENPTTHDIPIVFLTADRNPDNLAKALNAGASDYISKPFNAVELEARVRVALRTKQMIDLLQERARIDALTGLRHGIGDDVIRKVGMSIRGGRRPYDIACRFGGDEFGVILAQTDTVCAEQIAERIIDGVNKIKIRAGSDEIDVACSGGLASASEMPNGFEPAELLKAADEALYSAKREGRNRLAVAEPSD